MKIINVDNYKKLIHGDFNCNIVDRDGNIIRSISEENLVVNVSKRILAALLGGVGIPVTKIGFGTSTAPAALTDETLTSVYYKNIINVSFPTSTEWVQFDWYLAYDELVGVDIAEFGLFTASNDMFSRKVYSTPIPKGADMAFEGQWIIKFFQE